MGIGKAYRTKWTLCQRKPKVMTCKVILQNKSERKEKSSVLRIEEDLVLFGGNVPIDIL